MLETRQVRIVGSDEPWDVLCETESTMLLVNPAARLRRDQAALEQQLDDTRAAIARLTRQVDPADLDHR